MRARRFITGMLITTTLAVLLLATGPMMLSRVVAQETQPKDGVAQPKPPFVPGGPRGPRADQDGDRGDRRDDGPSRSWRESRGDYWGDRFGRRGSGSYTVPKPFPAPFEKEDIAIEEGIRIFHLMQTSEFREKFDQALKDNPERIHDLIKRSWPRVQMLIESEREDKALFDLRMVEMQDSGRIRGLIFRIHQAKKDDPSSVPSLQSDLKQVVTQRFDTRMKIRKHELAGLVDRVAKIKSEIDDMTKNREAQIDQAMERALASPSGPPGPRRDSSQAEAEKQ